MSIDYKETDRHAVTYLRGILRPVHYRELFRVCAEGTYCDYSDSTDVEEKLRQHYSEHKHPAIILVPGGDIALRYWFPIDHQPQIIGREPLVIDGNCLVSYKAGYEHAKREPHLYDYFGDGQTDARFVRRMVAYQLESHVRHFFRQNWPGFYRPPSNEGKYASPAPDDFSIELPDGIAYKIDVKSVSFAENGQGQYMARSIRDDTIYIAGEWSDRTQSAVVRGVVPGKWLRSVADRDNGGFFHDGELMSFEILPVMLNMAKCRMNWRKAYVELAKREAPGG